MLPRFVVGRGVCVLASAAVGEREQAPIRGALEEFAEAVTAKSSVPVRGGAEDRLRGPFEHLMQVVGAAWGGRVVCAGEAPLPGRLGRPDYAVHRGGLLAGYVELKAPGTGADAARFRGRDREQFKRFAAVPNLLYTDGNEWALYRGGERAGRLVRLAGDVAGDGRKAVGGEDARALEPLLRDFLGWEPVLPLDRMGRIDPKGFAQVLAPLCRMLRGDVGDALADPGSPLVQLARDWRQLLFPEATDGQFADAYAQTVAFALLLGRGEGADPLTLDGAVAALSAQHSLLSRALQVLTDPAARTEMSASLDLLLRLVSVVPPTLLGRGERDPWLYFYEDFLAAYDPKLRKDAGAYYTPVEVVRAQVRLVDDVLVHRLGRPRGFAGSGVVTLDPASGTGTYLLGVVEHALGRVEAEEGAGAVPGQAAALAEHLYGFELMVGPYAVSELRVSRALRDRGAPPGTAARVYLTDTLESPRAEPPQLPLFMRPIADQRVKALGVKKDAPVLVCLGNPPYDRHEAARADNGDRTGAWVRWGDDGKGAGAILRDFLDPAAAAGHGVRVKNLYNLYVYFWRWALWKVFEQEGGKGDGVVSFITASSYLDGDAFGGMREHLRRVCDEVRILDLGGEGRGTRRSENVFAIRTPVAVAVAWRAKGSDRTRPADVRYARVEGSRAEKLAALDAVRGLADVAWRECPDSWQAPFRPAGEGEYFAWPRLADLMPWQHSGVQLKRTWPIAPDPETLERRWRALLASSDSAGLVRAFKETRDRKIDSRVSPLFESGGTARPVAGLSRDAQAPRMERYAYRSFDRQWILADPRLGDYLRPALWGAHGGRQVYLTTLFNHPLGAGPALTACSHVPDLHHFRGSFGAKEVIPLYRAADAAKANVLPGLLERLRAGYARPVTAEDFAAYVYGLLAHPGFTARFAEELDARELRAPLTRDAALFEEVRARGARLLWLHTWGERFVPEGGTPGRVPPGAARCTRAVPGGAEDHPRAFRYDAPARTLHVGAGEYAPVAPEVYGFEVSGLEVVRSWLGYRMRNGAGRTSSPLDGVRPEGWTSRFTTELLELLWVLEATVEGWPEQERLLEAVVEGGCYRAAELPPVPEEMRKPPRARPAAPAGPALDLGG